MYSEILLKNNVHILFYLSIWICSHVYLMILGVCATKPKLCHNPVPLCVLQWCPYWIVVTWLLAQLNGNRDHVVVFSEIK